VAAICDACALVHIRTEIVHPDEVWECVFECVSVGVSVGVWERVSVGVWECVFECVSVGVCKCVGV
jgi:hypothetical protein